MGPEKQLRAGPAEEMEEVPGPGCCTWWAGVETAAWWDLVSSCLGLAAGSEKTKEMEQTSWVC